MSDLGRRLRQALDEVAPPADLDRIVAHEPALPFWRVGRVLAYGAVLMAVVAVTLVLLTADDMDDTATESTVTTVEGTETTLGEGEPPETDTAWTPQVLEPSYFVCSTSVEAVPCGRLFDGDPSMIWEAPDGGIGAVIEVGFDRPVEIIEVVFSPPSDEETRLRSARVSEFTVVAEGHSAIHGQMSDEPGDQRFGLDSVVTTGITISVDSAFPGVSYEGREPFLELALGEIQFLGRVAIGSPSAVPPALDTRPLSGQWFGTTPDTQGLIVLNNDLIWDGEAFYALTRLGFGDQVVWRSIDGVDWERYKTIALAGELGVTGVYSGPTELQSVDGRLYAAGSANGRATVWIDDGSSPWRSVDVGPGGVRALLHHDGRFVALGDSAGPTDDPVDRHPVIWISPDGENWGEAAGAELFGSVTWTSDLVAGPAGLLTIGFEDDDRAMNRVAGVFISEDGVSWSRHDPEFLDLTQVDSIVGWDGGYAAVGLDSRVLVSSDGIAWAPIGDRPAASVEGGFTHRGGLGFFDGRLLMVGGEAFTPSGSEFNTSHPRVWSYTEGGEWARFGDFDWFDQPGIVYEVVSGNGAFVALAEVGPDGPDQWALLTFVADRTVATGESTPTSVPLVPPEEWPYPALDPVLGLPDCGPSDVIDFIYEEFPEFGGRDAESLTAREIQDVMPLPRLGLDSVFTEVPTGWCFSARRIDDLTAWKLQGPDPDQYVFAAVRPRESNTVPDGVIDDYYHQSHIASGQGFNVSVRPEGRAVGLVDHDYFVMAGAALQPEGDIYLWGEDVAMSLYKAPLEDRDPGVTLIGSLFDPTGLPDGFGPCTVGSLVWEQSGEGAEWFRTIYCDGLGHEIEVLHGFGGDYPPTPAGGSEPWGAGPLTGTTWVEGGRRNIVFDIDERRNVAVWVIGPEDGVAQGDLSAVARSMLLLSPEIVNPRKGVASFPDAVDPDAALRERIMEAVSQAPDGVTIRTNQWPDDGTGGSMLDQALALGANRIERLEAVDVVVLDNGDRVQGIFSCGGLWFNIHVEPNPPQQQHDLTWSQAEGRYERIVEWLQVLENSLGCMSGTSSETSTDDLVPLHLYVSNQSFEVDPVHVVVSLDGAVVIDDEFFVEGQHNWVRHGLEIAPGLHEIRVDAYATGASLEETFEITGESWAVVDFWFSAEDGTPYFRWTGILDGPPAFF